MAYEPETGRYISNSPSARMMKKITTPATAYDSSSEGPACWIALAEPRNKPTPIAPPIAIIWMWRSFSPR